MFESFSFENGVLIG